MDNKKIIKLSDALKNAAAVVSLAQDLGKVENFSNRPIEFANKLTSLMQASANMMDSFKELKEPNDNNNS